MAIMESLINHSVQKMLVEPTLLKRADDTVDPDTLQGGKSSLMVKAGLELSNMGIPLNVTFSEPCPLEHV